MIEQSDRRFYLNGNVRYPGNDTYVLDEDSWINDFVYHLITY